MLQQAIHQLVQQLLVTGQLILNLYIGSIQDLLHPIVDVVLELVRHHTSIGRGHYRQILLHSVVFDQAISEMCSSHEVTRASRCDLLVAVYQILCGPSSQASVNCGLYLLLGQVDFILGNTSCKAHCTTSWQNGDLMKIVVTLSEQSNEGMSCLVSSTLVRLFLPIPILTLSKAQSKSSLLAVFFLFFTALRMAMLTRFWRSAPLKPTLNLAMFLEEIASWSTVIFFLQQSRMCSLPLTSGNGMLIVRSNLPGLLIAESKEFAKLVAPITMMLSVLENPSISVSSWFRAALQTPGRCLFLLPAIESISSMKMMHGAEALAVWNSFLTLSAPTPTKTSSKSAPDLKINEHPASPARALAKRVFPVPGAPSKRIPRGNLAPTFLYFPGFLRQSTSSVSYSLNSSIPMTSLNLVVTFFTSTLLLSDLSIDPNSMSLMSSLLNSNTTLEKIKYPSANRISNLGSRRTTPRKNLKSKGVFGMLTNCL